MWQLETVQWTPEPYYDLYMCLPFNSIFPSQKYANFTAVKRKYIPLHVGYLNDLILLQNNDCYSTHKCCFVDICFSLVDTCRVCKCTYMHITTWFTMLTGLEKLVSKQLKEQKRASYCTSSITLSIGTLKDILF